MSDNPTPAPALEPCPKTGCTLPVKVTDHRIRFRVSCECGYAAPFGHSEAEAIENWNSLPRTAGEQVAVSAGTERLTSHEKAARLVYILLRRNLKEREKREVGGNWDSVEYHLHRENTQILRDGIKFVSKLFDADFGDHIWCPNQEVANE